MLLKYSLKTLLHKKLHFKILHLVKVTMNILPSTTQIPIFHGLFSKPVHFIRFVALIHPPVCKCKEFPFIIESINE